MFDHTFGHAPAVSNNTRESAWFLTGVPHVALFRRPMRVSRFLATEIHQEGLPVMTMVMPGYQWITKSGTLCKLRFIFETHVYPSNRIGLWYMIWYDIFLLERFVHEEIPWGCHSVTSHGRYNSWGVNSRFFGKFVAQWLEIDRIARMIHDAPGILMVKLSRLDGHDPSGVGNHPLMCLSRRQQDISQPRLL